MFKYMGKCQVVANTVVNLRLQK